MDADIRSSYSALSDLYIDVCGTLDKVDPEDLAFLKKNLGDCDGPVLDVGCGPGHLTAYLTDLGLVARGIDLVPEFVDHARGNRPDIDFSVESLHSVEVPDGSLHGVLAWYSLIHCAPSEVPAALVRLRHAMVDRGVLVIGFFDSAEQIEPFDHKVLTAYRWPIDEMAAALVEAGFIEIDRAQRAADTARLHAALAVRAARR